MGDQTQPKSLPHRRVALGEGLVVSILPPNQLPSQLFFFIIPPYRKACQYTIAKKEGGTHIGATPLHICE